MPIQELIPVSVVAGFTTGIFVTTLTNLADLRSSISLRIQPRRWVPGRVGEILGIRELGLVPRFRSGSYFESAISPFKGNSETLKPAEYFQGIAASLALGPGIRGPKPRTFLITSACAGEGKTTTCANTAIALAQIGYRVLVIDGDLRRPSLQRAFDLPHEPGWNDLFKSDEESVISAVRPSGARNLSVLTATQSATQNTLGILGSGGMGRLLNRLRTRFDFILIDSPPVLGFCDAQLWGILSDSVLLVVRYGITPVREARNALAKFSGYTKSISGVVLNDIPLSKLGYYSYSGYYSDERLST